MYPILSYNYCQALLVACGPLEDWPKVYKAARKGRQFLTVGRDQLRDRLARKRIHLN